MTFEPVSLSEDARVLELSAMATEIVREHFDPLIGKAQNDYMLALFQTPEAIRGQLRSGYRYYFVMQAGERLGFLAFYPRAHAMYLSKFYLYKRHRGRGYARQMLDFVVRETRNAGLNAIELNVNKDNDACRVYQALGFTILRSEKNDIGGGFYMDDYVYRLDL